MTFDELLNEYATWIRHDEDDVHETASDLHRADETFWTDIDTLFEAARDDDTSPLKLRPATSASFIREGDSDGIDSGFVVLYVHGIKLATRVYEPKELCSGHEYGLLAAAEALATLHTAIDATLEPFAGLDMKIQGNDEAQRLLNEMRESIRQYREMRDEPERRQEHAVTAMFAAEKLDRLISNGASLPASWIDREAEAVRLAILSNARDEAERAHRFHEEAAAEVDKLHDEQRKMRRQIVELSTELEAAVAALDAKTDQNV